MSDQVTRGFGLLDEARRSEIARRGGRAAHERGTAHEFSSQEARDAGRKGGEAVSRDRAYMAAIGRKGGKSPGRDHIPPALDTAGLNAISEIGDPQTYEEAM